MASNEPGATVTLYGSAADLDLRDRVREILAGAPPACRLCGTPWRAHPILCSNDEYHDPQFHGDGTAA